MNLPKIRLSKPSLSPRFFIYCLLGLVILVLLVEGGYFFYLQQKKVKERSSGTKPISVESMEGKSQIVLEAIQEGLREGKIAGDVVFKGKVEKIEGRTVAMFAETTNFPVYVNVDVSPDAVFIKSSEHAQGGWEMLKGDYFNDIKVGSRIVFSDLLPGKENYFSSKRVIFEE